MALPEWAFVLRFLEVRGCISQGSRVNFSVTRTRHQRTSLLESQLAGERRKVTASSAQNWG
jgi:hypothetical protein